MSESILLQRDGAVVTLLLNAPERHNALTYDDFNAITAHLDQLANDPELRVLLITGAGEKTFCAGAELGEVSQGLAQGNRFQQMVDAVERFPRPVVCALNGSVYGGGVELALACDFRIGIEASRLFVPPARLGICYPYEGLARFVSRLGLSISKRLLIANEEFTSEQALAFGFYDYLVARELFDISVHDFCNKLCGLAPLSMSAMKQTLNELAKGQGSREQSRQREKLCMESQDLQEGLSAKAEKRVPRFTGN